MKQNVAFNQEENKEFDIKYRTFLAMKWDIIKAIKTELYQKRVRALELGRKAATFIILLKAVWFVKRIKNKFRRDQDVRRILRKYCGIGERTARKMRENFEAKKGSKDMTTR